MGRFSFSSTAVDVPALQRSLADSSCGGYAAFEGWVRNHNEGLAVTRLEYEAFEQLAVREGERIIEEACAKFGVENARCVHRVGELAIGDLAVWVGVSARHRDEAFRACRYIIDEVKHRVPIWKKEHYVNGDSGWVNCERCATAPSSQAGAVAGAHDHGHHHDHGHPHDHGQHHGHGHHLGHGHGHGHPHGHAPASPQPDYSRQMALREVGPAGQAKLRAATVAVIGAGGLGVPVLQYLAGAGVGRLVIIDGDRLEPSNLHRQTLYALADCGQPKAELAAARVRALNPAVESIAHTQRLDAANGRALLEGASLVIDCTDNFSTKFLLNDLAQQLRMPAVLASVYQYEGQLQVLRPDRDGACLRCVWPEATRDGLVGNCAEAGVLGPVPGVFGALQALEAMKVLLDLPGQLGDELLVFDLTTLSSSRVRTRRSAQCPPGPCTRSERDLAAALARDAALPAAALELEFDDLDHAAALGYVIIDIREPAELRAQPTPARAARHVPLAELLAGGNLPADARYLLVCARGARSLSAARALRERGLGEVYSLRGGLAARVAG
jgi:molybdopterin/thiamine biosynthesis adenylyltransferase/molybdopterin synthase catalytic subunit/rhodanese-related sulfurtransferase